MAADPLAPAGLGCAYVARGRYAEQIERWLDARIEEEFPGSTDRISAAHERASDGSGFQPPPQRRN